MDNSLAKKVLVGVVVLLFLVFGGYFAFVSWVVSAEGSASSLPQCDGSDLSPVSDEEREECYYAVAVLNRDARLCGLLADEEQRQSCVVEVEEMERYPSLAELLPSVLVFYGFVGLVIIVIGLVAIDIFWPKKKKG